VREIRGKGVFEIGLATKVAESTISARQKVADQEDETWASQRGFGGFFF